MGVISISKKETFPEPPAEAYGAKGSSLLSMPDVLADLLSACLQGASPQSVVEIILQDAPFAAHLIDVAVKGNNNKLDATEPVTAAVNSLGYPMIVSLVLQSARQVLEHKLSATEISYLRKLWRTSRFTGQAARCIAPSVNYPYIEEAQLCGLLQNLGLYQLLARHGDLFLDKAPVSWSCEKQAVLEQESFQTDHLRLAADKIESWGLDSFLADAIRFLMVDSGQLQTANPLFRIARMAQLFAGSDGDLNPEAGRLGELFFNLRPSETDYLFEWVTSLSAPAFKSTDNDATSVESFNKACRRLTRQIFLVASQEAARARLTSGTTPEEIAEIARSLYLENSQAKKVHFFLLDQRRQELIGISSKDGSRLSRELKLPLISEASLAARALSGEGAVSSFTSDQALTVTDHLLLRLGGGKGFVCYPLISNDHPLAVVVFGFDNAYEADGLQSPAITILHPIVSAALAQVSMGEFNRIGDGALLLRRVNHEISSPLTIIGNYAEVLKHNLSGRSGRELAEAIKQESQRVDEIVHYYLNQQDTYEFPDQEIDINQLVQETVDTLREAELTPRNIEVIQRFQQDLPQLSSMAILIRQILVNLIKNAAEALDHGGQITLVTREGFCSERGRYVEIHIADNGPGIPPAIRDRLFRPVVSTKGGGHAGSGLSIVKGMVEDLGGRISCHSGPEQGTGFYLQLPIVDDFSLFT
ncbi:MAG: ATP-binding protein [Pelovirga sp.]